MPGTLNSPRMQPPGPRGHWLWGCSGELQRDPLGFYERTWREYGDFARVRIVPGMYLYMLFRPEDVEQVLVRNHRNYRKPDFFNKPLGSVAGRGLVTSDGELWKTQRKLAQPAFHRDRLALLGVTMAETAESCAEELSRGAAGQTVDIQQVMSRLTLKIAGETLFGADLSSEASSLGGAFKTAFEHVHLRMNNQMLPPEWIPTAENRRFRRAKAVLDRVVEEMIQARRRENVVRNDLLGTLLAARDDETGKGMSDAQLRDEVLTLLLAGNDTVGAALSWSWYLLGQHPEIQDEVAAEVKNLPDSRAPMVGDLAALPLTRAVFEETLRLYPPAPGQPRQALGPDEMNGYVIPKNSFVMVCQWVTHRDPQFWTDPNTFNPRRFLADDDQRPKFSYFPFGGGPRSCIGQHFAMMEGILILATILRQFRVELVPGQTIEPDTTFTLKPKPGVNVRLWPR
ncbi:MAG: cytochrome [Schlesneria sp.]|nr:cytochrome [Schlesneria sp.]